MENATEAINPQTADRVSQHARISIGQLCSEVGAIKRPQAMIRLMVPADHTQGPAPPLPSVGNPAGPLRMPVFLWPGEVIPVLGVQE